MSNAIEYFSRCRVENTTLQVMADLQHDLDRLIREEKSVIRHYVRLGIWPHKRVNMFVLENLQPLVAQIKSATEMSSVIANDIDRRPMVNVYDAADLTECAVFVNRGALERDGVWHDDVALRALLAHEHGHPLAENETVRVARELSVKVVVEGRAPMAAVGQILHLLADRLCVHAPQEVFANEMAIRAGFGDALFHLDKDVTDKARLSVSRRPSLVQSLQQQATAQKLSADQAAALLLVGDLQAHLPFALEIAPFLRAGHRQQAQTLEAALIEGVLSHLDPAALPLYEKMRDHYLKLRTDLSSVEMKAWSSEALGFLADGLRERHLGVRFALVRTRSDRKSRRQSRMEHASIVHSSIEHDGGLP
ncbi:MAG: hypothetical protein ABSC37_01710 [Xanthobacteraceae bacterium]